MLWLKSVRICVQFRKPNSHLTYTQYGCQGYFILIEYSYPYFWPEKYTQNTLNFLQMSTQIQKEPLRNLFFKQKFRNGVFSVNFGFLCSNLVKLDRNSLIPEFLSTHYTQFRPSILSFVLRVHISGVTKCVTNFLTLSQ